MKRYALLAIVLGLALGATARWARTPVSSDASDSWLD
jgi:hypothetical protein